MTTIPSPHGFSAEPDASRPEEAAQAPQSWAQLLDHEYDGIREYDNPVPGWMHLIFWASVVFSVLYFGFFQFSPASWSVHDRWESAQAAAYQRIFGKLGALEPDGATIVGLSKNDQLMSVARGFFVTNCAQCHGKEGGGINGVNLTDDSYKNARTVEDLYTVITKGAAAGAMPAWENRLSQNERILLAAYTARMRGTNVAGGKGPEGEQIAAWPDAPALGTE